MANIEILSPRELCGQIVRRDSLQELLDRKVCRGRGQGQHRAGLGQHRLQQSPHMTGGREWADNLFL